MKVFVATKKGQGKRDNDFCFTEENELVMFGTECDGETIDGPCGCRRSMVGFRTLKATTTFKAVDMNITRDDFFEFFNTSMEVAGYGFLEERFSEYAIRLLNAVKPHPLDMVLEKRGDVIQVREM